MFWVLAGLGMCKQNNPVKTLNLSDKIFLELDNELVAESLSSIHTLKVRYSTFSNDQINMILKKTCQQKKLKVLDFLGANIIGRVGFEILIVKINFRILH